MAITAAALEVRFTSSGAGRVKSELKGLDDAVKAAGSGFEQMYQKVTGFADRAVGSITRVADGIGKAGLAGIAAIFTKGTVAAVQQVSAVEQATLALRAYETDARKVDKVLSDLLTFARSDAGKMFMREELFKAATTLRVAGAETENLTRYVEIMSRSVNAGMGTWIDLERVIARVGSTGRLTGIEFELLQQMGFQLDSSLRNTTVTWEELFDVLDKGSVQVSGQSDTIQGKLMSLNTAIRGIGVAFLGIDSETSKFTDGLLGDRMVQGIDLAIAALGRLQDTARSAGNFAATILDGVEGLVAGFRMLPGPIQEWSLKLIGAIAAVGMFRQAIAGLTAAMRLMGLSAFTGLFSPLGLAITGVAIAGGLLIKSFMDQKAAAAEYNATLSTLDDTLEQIRRRGDEQLAETGKSIKGTIQDIHDSLTTFGNIDQPFNEAAMQRADESLADYRDRIDRTREAADLAAPAMAAFNAALNDPNVNIDAYSAYVDQMLKAAAATEDTADDIEALNWIIDSQNSMDPRFLIAYAGAVDTATTALDRLIESGHNATGPGGPFDPDFAPEVVEWDDFVRQVEENIAASRDRIRDGMNEMLVDWLKDGDNFLDWWQAFDQVLIESSGGMAVAGEAWQSFRQNVIPTAAAIDEANRSFDQVLRTFDQIDQLASRPSKAQSIVQQLVGEPGEWAAIDDLLESGRISLEQYNQTVQSGLAISESAARSQMILNEIRADQLPLLEAETLAYEKNLEAIAALEPAEQRRVLMLQDTAVQAQVAELYSTAYAASLGQIPPEVATQMILNAAEADAGLKDLLLNLGLISEIDGEIRVNFPDADKTIQAIDRVTQSVLMLADLMDNQKLDGSIKLTIEGDKELNDLYGDLINVDGTEATASATVDTGGAEDSVRNMLDAVRSVDGYRALIEVNGDASGATGAVDLASTLLAGLDGQSAMTYQYGDNANALSAITDVTNNLAGLDGSTATVTINAIDNAGGVIGSIASQLWALDGQSATVTTNYVTRYSTQGGSGSGFTSHAAGGYVRSLFQLVGEHGPELVQLPYGSYVHTAAETRGMMADENYGYGGSTFGGNRQRGDSISVTVNIKGGIISQRELTEDIVEDVADAMEGALSRRRRGYGVAVA